MVGEDDSFWVPCGECRCWLVLLVVPMLLVLFGACGDFAAYDTLVYPVYRFRIPNQINEKWF